MCRTILSIIICTRDRAESLRETLHSLSIIELPNGQSVELLVVDNGSRDGTQRVVEDCRPFLSSYTVQYIFEPRGGKAAAQNTGLHHASGSVILFTDDDIRFPIDWIAQMSQPILNNQADAVAGGVRLASYLLRDWMTPMHRCWLASTERLQPEQGQLVGANMAFGRHVLEKVPGFDEQLGPGALGFCDDDCFAYQLRNAGFRFKNNLSVEVEHHPSADRLSRGSFLNAAAKQGRSMAYFVCRYQGWSLSFARLRRLKHRVRRTLFDLRQSRRSEMTPNVAELEFAKADAFWHQYFVELTVRALQSDGLVGIHAVNAASFDSKVTA